MPRSQLDGVFLHTPQQSCTQERVGVGGELKGRVLNGDLAESILQWGCVFESGSICVKSILCEEEHISIFIDDRERYVYEVALSS